VRHASPHGVHIATRFALSICNLMLSFCRFLLHQNLTLDASSLRRVELLPGLDQSKAAPIVP
jgi:hypothetical protein